MKFAVIKTGGKQYLVKENDKVKIEKIIGEEGQKIDFDQVLLVVDGDKIEIGQPLLKNKKISAKILKQGKGDKVTVIKFHKKKRYRRKRGHRQLYTQILIEKV